MNDKCGISFHKYDNPVERENVINTLKKINDLSGVNLFNPFELKNMTNIKDYLSKANEYVQMKILVVLYHIFIKKITIFYMKIL